MSLKIENISFKYNSDNIIENLNIDLKFSKLNAIIGVNGSGKTTLLKIILKILKQQSGNIYYNDINIKDWNIRKMAKHIAYVPQHIEQSFSFLVIDVILMRLFPFLKVYEKPSKEDEERCLAVLKEFDILDLAYKHFLNLSGGQKQLVLICRAIFQGTKIILLDEPTENLDFYNYIFVMNKLKKISLKGYSIIFTSHQINQIYLFADNLIVLKDKHIVKQGDPNVILTKELIKEIYNVDVKLIEENGKKFCIPIV